MKRFWMFITATTIAAAVGFAQVQAQQTGETERLLAAAQHVATVDGDLSAAIKQYQAIVDKFSKTDRRTAATALLRMAECYQKTGDVQARAVFERIVREFGDQADALQAARGQLARSAGQGPPATASPRLVSAQSSRGSTGGYPIGELETVSRDGRYGIIAGHDDIGIRDMTTGDMQWLGIHANQDRPVLSPDHSQIAYAEFPSRNVTWLRVVAARSGATPRTLLSNPDIDYLLPGAWSRDGQSILVAVRRLDQTWQLGWVSVTNGAFTVLKSLDWRFLEDGFDLSPDGRYVAYTAKPQNPSKPRPSRLEAPDSYIYVVPASGAGPEMVLVKNAGRNSQPIWTADGAHVLFQNDQVGTCGLWAIEIQDGKASGVPRLIKDNIGEANPVGMTRAGTFYYEIYSPDAQVDVLSMKAGASNTTIDSVPGADLASWSPDGRRLALRGFSRRGGFNNFDLIIHSLETGEDRSFVIDRSNGMAMAAMPPVWLHDGNRLLVGMLDYQGATTGSSLNLKLLDLKTGRFTDFPLSPNETLTPGGFSADDREFYAIRFADKTVSLVAIDIATHGERELFTLETNRSVGTPEMRIYGRLSLSPDGRALLYTTRTKALGDQIYRIGVDGSDHRQIYQSPASEPAQLLDWSPDGTSALIEKNGEILRVPASGGVVQSMEMRVPSIDPQRNDHRFLVLSPDATRVAIARSGFKAEIFAIDNIPALLGSSKR